MDLTLPMDTTLLLQPAEDMLSSLTIAQPMKNHHPLNSQLIPITVFQVA